MVTDTQMTFRHTIGEVLQMVGNSDSTQDQINILRSYDSLPLRQFLRYCFDPAVILDIPSGPVPYKQNTKLRPGSSGSDIYGEMKRMYIFLTKQVPGENFAPDFAKDTKQNKMKKEMRFVNMLESCYPEEAEYLIQMKDKSLDIITTETVEEAFPHLFEGQYKFRVAPTGTPKMLIKDMKYVAQGVPQDTSVVVNGVTIKLNPKQYQEYMEKISVKVAKHTEEQIKALDDELTLTDEDTDVKTTENNTFGKCKSCKAIITVCREFKGGIFQISCKNCGVSTQKMAGKLNAMKAWRNLKENKLISKKIKEEKKPLKKIVKPSIITPTKEEINQHSIAPYPDQGSMVEDVIENTNSEVAEPAFVPDTTGNPVLNKKSLILR